MTPSAEQRTAIAQWVAAGDSLSTVQRRLTEQFKLSLTYMEVRFLVDDLGLELKSPVVAKPAPSADLNAAKSAAPAAETEPAKKGLFGKLKDAVGGKRSEPPSAEPAEEDFPPDEDDLTETQTAAEIPLGASAVQVEVDRICRPGTLASGSVTFSDGVAGKWAMDQHGRLMLDAGKGYKPSPPDIQAFQTELSIKLQRMGY